MKQLAQRWMKHGKGLLLMTLVIALSLLGLGTGAASAGTPVLTDDDCIKCHDKPVTDIETNGGKHKTEISCTDCHEGHPPRVKDIIPQCSQCHSDPDTPHFQLKGCLQCHTNPHTPLEISIADNITEPCLTCHTEQMAELKQYESKHTEVACTTCHRETHGMIPECTQCHSPHTNDMTPKDCLTCHKPHMPLEVTYPDDVPSKDCAACHDTEYSELAASKYKHHDLACAKCHPKKHKTIPQCTDCHGVPHPKDIMAKFPHCGDCHGTAHDLNKLK